jgi:hypothetical protein
VDGFGGVDKLVMRISILCVIIIVITVTPQSIVNGFWSIIVSKLLGVDVPEEATVLHGVIGLGMDLVGTLQGLIVVLLVVPTTTWLLSHVDFMIVLTRTLASKGVAAVVPPIMVIWEVAVVIALITIILTTVIAIVIMAWWVFGA